MSQHAPTPHRHVVRFYVENISFTITEVDLQHIFEQFRSSAVCRAHAFSTHIRRPLSRLLADAHVGNRSGSVFVPPFAAYAPPGKRASDHPVDPSLENEKPLFLLSFFRSLLRPSDWLFLFRFSSEEVKKTSPFLALNGLCFKRCPMIVSLGTDVGFHLNVGYLFPSFYRGRYNLCRFFVRGRRLCVDNGVSDID